LIAEQVKRHSFIILLGLALPTGSYAQSRAEPLRVASCALSDSSGRKKPDGHIVGMYDLQNDPVDHSTRANLGQANAALRLRRFDGRDLVELVAQSQRLSSPRNATTNDN
jgi:hypothetical protein